MNKIDKARRLHLLENMCSDNIVDEYYNDDFYEITVDCSGDYLRYRCYGNSKKTFSITVK